MRRIRSATPSHHGRHRRWSKDEDAAVLRDDITVVEMALRPKSFISVGVPPPNGAAEAWKRMRAQVKRPIDWRAVQFVLQGECMDLTPAEKRMVMRRLEPKMLTFEQNRDEFWSPSTAAN